jgi:hypothetical protein
MRFGDRAKTGGVDATARLGPAPARPHAGRSDRSTGRGSSSRGERGRVARPPACSPLIDDLAGADDIDTRWDRLDVEQ